MLSENKLFHPRCDLNAEATSEFEILREMSKFDPDESHIHDNDILSYLIHYANIFAKCARALSYEYGFLRIDDFNLDLRNYTKF